jgi:hypothetical protein
MAGLDPAIHAPDRKKRNGITGVERNHLRL